MLTIFLLVLFLASNSSFGKLKKENTQSAIKRIFSLYDSSEYDKAISGLDKIQSNIVKHSKSRKDIQGLIYYWKGLCYIKLNEYELAVDFLKKAIDLKFEATDIFYEYGQSLYALDKLKKARVAFKKSVEKKFKRGVSLYYMAYISQELKDYKKAVAFYNAIEKLDDEEKVDVIQPARMQVGDIYLKQVEKMPDTFSSVEKYVIPQYKKALDWDKDSKLAQKIREKITMIQKRYDLLLFKMRNGVPTAIPRHFVKFSAMLGVDDNVTDITNDAKEAAAEEDYASGFTTTSFFGRYSFYPNSSYSISPELSIDYNKYQSDSTAIKIYNSTTYRTGVQLNYEHLYKNSPATLYINIDYTMSYDDADGDDKQEASSTTSSVQISEGFQLWAGNPTTMRYRFSKTTAEDETLSYNTNSFIWEQVVNRGGLTLFFFSTFELNRYDEAQTANTNIFTFRGDWIWPTIFGLINPNLFASTKMINYIESDERGVTNLLQYGLSLNRPIGGNKWYITFDYINESQTGQLDSDIHEGTRYSINLDYLY